MHGTRAGEEILRGAHRRRDRGEHIEGDRFHGGKGDSLSVRSSSCSLPHHPQLEEVIPNRGVGAGARPPVSTVTTLNSVSTADPLAQ